MSGDYPPILDELGYGAPSDLTRIGGGCIANAAVANFNNGARCFVKWVTGGRGSAPPEMFEREAEGLRALAATRAIRVPTVMAIGRQALVLEMIDAAPRKHNFAADFGRRFAALHDHRGKTCGFMHDNFIGASTQYNTPLDAPWDEAAADDGSGWPEFFLERRLRIQAVMATRNGYGSDLELMLDRAEPRILEHLCAATEKPSLLHGDLWGGNFIVDEHGDACLIDPAVYYGHREADLAMTRLFGGFEPSFYSAYAEVSPLVPGHEERLPIYQLYHVLNHLNLFGAGYFEQSKRLLQRYVL